MKATDFDRQFSARQVIDDYEDNDMPLGWFLPNDGYGAGYGQNGYYKTGGVNSDGTSSAERLNAVRANVDNLKKFTEYANSKGVSHGACGPSPTLSPIATPRLRGTCFATSTPRSRREASLPSRPTSPGLALATLLVLTASRRLMTR